MALSKNMKIGIGALAVIVIALAIYLNSAGGPNLSAYINQPANATQVAQLKAIAMNSSLAAAVGPGVAAYPKNITGAALMKINNKPGVLYIGAEYCPFCAAERWGMIIAMMRFGNFSNLHYTISSTTPGEVYPGTATFTFYNSTYSSSVIGFASEELQNQTKAPLQTMNASQSSLFTQYNYANGAIPFMDFGNVSVQVGSSYSPQIINGKTWSQIISQLSNPSSPIAQGVIGTADVLTAQICKETNQTPSSVCSQPYIKKIRP